MKDLILKDINILIDELAKTNNSTEKYFSEIRDELLQVSSSVKENELLDILSKSSRIMDAGGFNHNQQIAWEKMFNSIMENLSKHK